MNNGNQVYSFVLDFSKACDRAPHRRLLYKLNHYGINGRILSWIGMFLTQRKQKLSLKEIASNRYVVICSVPQGTVL